ELGLPEAELPFDALQDPYGKAFWPTFKGRDGCRTPLPWDTSERAGFTSGEPWLPIPASHRALDIASQQDDPASKLHGFRRFLGWRKRHAALLDGAIGFIDSAEPVIAFVRGEGSEAMLMAFNLGDAQASVELGERADWIADDGHGLPCGHLQGQRLILPAYGMYAARARG
ncbi:alpha-glucosidase, partial [Lysobacter sp. 2RAB21]